MTNETAPHGNGVADPAAIAAITGATDATPTTASTEPPAEAAEARPPSFDDLGLHPDIKLALDDMGYFQPTPVQTAVFGPVSAGKDLLVQSRTGTGKTTAFGLPTLSKLVPTQRSPQALILAPTRELALQVARELTAIGKHRGIIVEAIYGGAPIGKQITNLKNGVHVVVGTPGRVLDHIGRRTLDTKNITTFVIDECDEMLSMGFLEDIERVVSHLPEKKQTLLFSATMPDEVSRYARRHMVAPEQISLSRDQMTVSDIHHAYYIVSGIARSRDLLKVIFAEEPESAIIFCNMRDETTMVAKFLQKQGLDAEPLSSDLSQADRERVMGRMKQKNLRFLCATDVAARGIDISNLSHVINYSVPESPEVYVHRTGRTGRAGKKGTAISLVGPRELGNFRYVRLTFGIKPEERVLPKDDIFVGKLKVALPPVGVPQPPDPVQILIRGVQGQASELEAKIFEKLYTTANGKRVLAKLVAERLDQLTTKSRPRPARVERTERTEGDGEERGERRFDREDRPRRFDGERGERGERGDREDRPRRFDRDGERPRRDREDRPRFGEGDRERPRFGDGERGERGDRERRPWRSRDEERGEGREARGERGDREGRRFDRDRDRDRGRHEHREETAPAAAVEAAPEAVETRTETSAEVRTERPERTERTERHEGERERRDFRDRDRGERRDRRDRDRDRGERHDRTERTDRTERVEAAPVTEPTPAPVETVDATTTAAVEPTKVEDVARAALDRHDRKGGKRDKKAEPTAETREFWETWAEEKSTRPAPAPSAAPAAAPAAAAEAEPEERGGRRGRDRDRGRGRDKDKGRGRKDAAEKTERAEKADKDEKAPKSKREAAAAPAPAADGAQARLFVSLGKKHGVTADDLRTLLAGPIGGDTARIGSVSLRDSHAHVRVPEELAEAIIGGVNGTQHNDHDVTVERARA
jgi:ATP-dependent RNA helicase DeaD